MWTAVGLISLFTTLAAFVAIVIGLIIGITRKRWKVLQWSAVVCGTALVLFIVAEAMDTRSDDDPDTGTTSAGISRPVATAQPQPTVTPVPTFEDYKSNAGTIEYEELFRNNEKYESQDFYFEGEVVQVIERRNDEYDFRIRIGRILDDEVIYLSGYKGQRLLEDDAIEFVGKSKGLHSYNAVLGNRVTLPKLEAVSVKLASNYPTEDSSPTLAGKSRNTPIPFGETGVTDDGLTLSVIDVIENAEQMILEENQFNDPPPDGHQFILVKVRVKNDTSETQRYSSSGLKVVGQSNVEYDGHGCGVVPDAFDSSRNMFEGGELTGNICFNVESSDVDSLVMYDSNAYDSSDWVFFALR